jgi:uncharacterized protein YndB with AHSA1/START domain
VFGVVDDFTQAPRWLESCVELTQVSAGARVDGARLRYVFDQAGRRSEMAGVLVSYEAGRRIVMKFVDARFEVMVGIELERTDAGTSVTHTIEIQPKAFLARLMSPLIRAGNRRQVTANLRRLRELCESAA